MVAFMWIFRRFSAAKVDKVFRRAQLFSAALYSLGHGSNDAQKTMGIIAGVLVASNYNSDCDQGYSAMGGSFLSRSNGH